jgi:hypothetical protein
MRQATDADIDRLAAALARLLAAYWGRLTSADVLANDARIQRGDDVLATDARIPHVERGRSHAARAATRHPKEAPDA